MHHGQLYRQIVSALTDGIVALDLDGTIRFANPSALALLRAEALEGRHMHDFLDEAGRRHSREHLARAAQGQLLDDEVDTMLVRADGTPLWVRLRQTGLVEDGRVGGVILRLTDNHETKRLLEEAHESRRGLMRAERIARSGSWTWDLVAGTTTHSEGLEELYGDHVGDLLGADRARVSALTHPEDVPRLMESLDKLLSGEGPRVDVELRQLGRAGWMWVRLRAWGTYDASGALTEVSGTFQDITRARDTEDQLQDLVTQNSLMQAVATAANEATSLDEVLTLAGSMVVLHDDWDRARAFVPDPDGDGVVPHLALGDEDDPVDATERAVADESFRTGRSVWDSERRLTLASPVRVGDDIVAVVTITSLPPLYRHDMVQHMVEQASLLISRVAEREAYALALAEARDRALEVSQHKSDFLTTMSHEIRTPLNGIIGLNELLGATTLSDRQRHLVSGVAVSSRALLDLINDILDFSKIEAGRLEVESVDFEVRELLAEVGDMLADTARSRELDLRVSCSADVPDVLRGDPTRLRQVLLNLGSNALKFTKVGSVDIRASATPLEPGEGEADDRCLLRLDVTDTGMGMTAAQREHVFAPFAQADTSTTRRFGGTGLGLAICTEIVAAFGGEIGVETEPGAGSTFWFTAPLPVATAGPADAALATARRALRGLRVLVVDDDSQDRELLVEQLLWWGVAADQLDGVEQVAATLTREHDAVLLCSDVLLTGAGLAEAVDRIGLPPGLPVVLLTPSYVVTDSALRAAGVATCLPRPVSSSALRDALLLVRPGGAPRRGAVTVPPAASGPVDRGRVLVVEDNQINQLVARGFLEAMGFEVLTADDGEAALALLDDVVVDAVLMDVQMPGKDGLETTRALRRREREQQRTRLPVLALTAGAISGERERCLSAGMDDFLTKPVSAAALGAALQRWLPTAADGTPTGPRRPELPPSPHLDQDRLAELLDIGPGAETYVDRAIDNFLRRRPEVISGITRAVEDADAPALRALAHSLRGSAGNLGLPTVAALAGRLEAGGDDGTTEGLMLLVVDLATALADAAEALLAYRGRLAQA